ncbi:GNAT family N-acetyltransferase [soil metagenome]
MTDPIWPAAETIATARLTLEPLRVEHAAQMAPAFDDERLHEFTGGQPATLEQLRERYAKQVVGRSADGTQGWCNWVVRHRGTGAVVGTVQATLQAKHGRTSAEIAWVVAVPHQGRGYASEAAAGMAAWLTKHGAQVLVAHAHPEHHASIGVARSLGLSPSDVIVDGEIRWTT